MINGTTDGPAQRRLAAYFEAEHKRREALEHGDPYVQAAPSPKAERKQQKAAVGQAPIGQVLVRMADGERKADVFLVLDRSIARTEQILDVIRSFGAHNGYPPTYIEIARIMNLSKSSISQAISRLVRRGRLTRQPRDARSLRIVPA